MTTTATRRRHVFFAADSQDEKDSAVVAALKAEMQAKNIRYYQPKRDEDVNTSIARGIEGASVVLVFASPALQRSKTGSKVVNYADQTKTPLLNVKHRPEFQPTDWLGAILAPVASCAPACDEILNTISSVLQIHIAALTVSPEEQLQLQSEAQLDSENAEDQGRYFFYGGTAMGNVDAYYGHGGSNYPMAFEFLGLEDGRVFGQGDDQVGAFTIAGNYDQVSPGDCGNVSFCKQYIGRHTVYYSGSISLEGATCTMQGTWEIPSDGTVFSDAFGITLALSLPSSASLHPQKGYSAVARLLQGEALVNGHEPSATMPGGKASSRGTRVLVLYCSPQHALSERVTAALTAAGIPAELPELDVNAMIRAVAENAAAVVPLMSQAYQDSAIANKVLAYAERAGVPIVPVKAQKNFTQSSWLGVICAGALWTQITDDDSAFDQKIKDLIVQLSAYTSPSSSSLANGDSNNSQVLVDGINATGYYLQQQTKHPMRFDMFAMVNGNIAGQGDDEIGPFVIQGTYLPEQEPQSSYQVQFVKQYLGKHQVIYAGVGRASDDGIYLVLQGTWTIGGWSDGFELQLPLERQSSQRGLHIMLSYQWNSQETVKKVADLLRSRNIRIWFDISGDMKGNINAAMANGVEKAAAVVSFTSSAYSKSVNCQKELNYASQLKKQIIPVLLEDASTADNWLRSIVASLNAVNMQDNNQFNESSDLLVQRIDAILKQREAEDESSLPASKVTTRFEGGSVAGKYYQQGQGVDMYFEFFSLRQGRVSGQGEDQIGVFTMAGTYDNSGAATFIKQYIGKHQVQYDGTISYDSNGGFRMEGSWWVGALTDKFYLQSLTSAAKKKMVHAANGQP